jgi:hypothetical protein
VFGGGGGGWGSQSQIRGLPQAKARVQYQVLGIYAPPIGFFIYGKAWGEDYHDPKFKHKSRCLDGEGSYTHTLRVEVILHLAIKL